MTALLARFRKPSATEQPRSVEEAFRKVVIEHDRSSVPTEVDKIVTTLVDDAQRDFHDVQVAAYFRYLNRIQTGDHPFHGRHEEDWFEAEAAFPAAPVLKRKRAG